jgi:glycine/D-amino acid oxidase-like deaminating enzyme
LPKGERIAVVGAGPAGLSYALLVARDNTVTVYERDDRPGGAFRYAGRAPKFQDVDANQDAFDAYITELERACRESGVTFHYRAEVSPNSAALDGHDRIVIATGARYRYGVGILVKLAIAFGLGRSGVVRRFFSSDRRRTWFYYRAREGTGNAYRAPVRNGRKVVMIGDAVTAGKAKEAIESAFRAAYGLKHTNGDGSVHGTER